MNQILPIDDPSGVAEGRRLVARFCREEGLSEQTAGRAALVVTELGTNLLKHAKSGEIHLCGISRWCAAGVEIVSVDRGPGMPNLEHSLRDGTSTSGTAGNGLGAVIRLSDEFDIWSEPGYGTTVLSRVRDRDEPHADPVFELGAVCRAVSGETISGDAWSIRQAGSETLLMLADGLGHGVAAGDASASAVAAFRTTSYTAPVDVLREIHQALRGTRGAAVAVAAMNWNEAKVRFAGIGNIAGTVAMPSRTQSMISHNGTAGHEARRFQEFTYALPEGALVAMHSDGLATHWSLESHPGLTRRHPALIAAALYRDAARSRDDACVVVVRRRGQ